MPVCMLYTNVKRSAFEENIEERIAERISETLDFPKEFVYVMIHAELPSFMGGSNDPAVVCHLRSMFRFKGEKPLEEYYPKLFDILKETTKVPGNRTVIEFLPVDDGMAQVGK